MCALVSSVLFITFHAIVLILTCWSCRSDEDEWLSPGLSAFTWTLACSGEDRWRTFTGQRGEDGRLSDGQSAVLKGSAFWDLVYRTQQWKNSKGNIPFLKYYTTLWFRHACIYFKNIWAYWVTRQLLVSLVGMLTNVFNDFLIYLCCLKGKCLLPWCHVHSPFPLASVFPFLSFHLMSLQNQSKIWMAGFTELTSRICTHISLSTHKYMHTRILCSFMWNRHILYMLYIQTSTVVWWVHKNCLFQWVN